MLLVWRDRNSVAYDGKEGFLRACDAAARSTSRLPTAEDKALVALILSRKSYGPKISARASQVLCEAACAWKDTELWRKAIAVFGPRSGADGLTGATLLSGAQQFGFATMRERCDRVCLL